MENTALTTKTYLDATLGEFFGEYEVATVDEFFEILDNESAKRSKMIAKSLTKYLKNTKTSGKYDKLVA